jgi:3-phenylpropionate/trans-cinnamate dioxygenase ferredoxin component
MSDLATDAFDPLGPAGAIQEDSVRAFYLSERKRRIAVARVGGRLYAFDDLCTCAEDRCPLSGGLLNGATVMCQCHGSRFDMASGAVIEGVATAGLQTYDVREADGTVEIRA